MKTNYTIDAKDKKIGRVATEAANYLTGKNTTSYERNLHPDVLVKIINAKEMLVDEKKLKTKEYHNYSGYPGGLKVTTAERMVEKKGYGELLIKAIYGMVPSNRLRPEIMKNLIITE